MAREYTRIHDYFSFVPLQGVQPITPAYHSYDPYSANANEAPGYELTTGGGGVGGSCGTAAAGALVVAAHSQQAQMQPSHPQKRKNSANQYSDSYDNMSGCDVPVTTPATAPQPTSMPRKRKTSSYGNGSVYDDDATEDTRSTRSMPDKKQNHSEIEKRRRDKMNTYISELSAMIPMCGAMARKLDKLTVLRLAVQHLRSVRGSLSACPLSARPRPSFLSERELNTLILHAAQDCFLLVVGCDRGRLLYVSTSVQKMLHYDQVELLGQSLFDILHPKDVAKVKEQLSSSDLSPRERLIDAKTMLPVKADVVAGASRLCPGARRSFFCRIKCKATIDAEPTSVQVKDESEPSSKIRQKQKEKKYCVVQFTGYLKSWAPAEMSETSMNTNDGSEDSDDNNLTCLVAVGRALPDLVPAPYTNPRPFTRHLQYVSRHAPDGKFLFVDQRVTIALGFLPQELLGTSLYEYVNGPELGVVAGTHKTALLCREPLYTPPYSFRKKDGSLAKIQTHFKTFKNPWTKDVEYLVANNTIVTDSHGIANPGTSHSSYDIYNQKPDVEMQRLIESQVESHKIGTAIVEDAIRRPSTGFSPDVTADLFQDIVFNQQATLVDNMLAAESYESVRNNVTLSAAGGQNSPPPSLSEHMQGTPPPASPPLPPLSPDGNGEAAMAVIMSLLEADAGLGGPVNFSGLPWPLA